MLQIIRKNLKHLSVLVWVGIAAFVVGGGFLFVSGPFHMGKDVVAKVNKTTITMENFQNTYQRLYRFYSQLLSNNFTDEDLKKLNLKQKAVDILIERALFIQEAKKRNIKATNEDVQKTIEKMSIFWDKPGHFSQQRYLTILKTNGVQPKNFEASLRTDIIIDKLKNSVASKVFVSDNEIKNYIDKNYTPIRLAYVKLDRKSLVKDIKPQTKDVKSFYDKHKNSFKLPVEMKIIYTEITLKFVEKNIKIDDKKISNYYKGHQNQFTVPEKREVYHILIKIPPRDNDKEWQKGKEKINKIYRELKSGKNFATLAKRYSEDPFSKKKSGYLGYITRNAVVEEFGNTVFHLKKGEMSKPFKTIYGYHIVKVTDINPKHILPFEDVKEKITQKLRVEKSKKSIFKEAKKMQVELRGNPKSFEQIVQSKGLKATKTGFFSIRNVKKPLNKDIIEQSLYMDKGKVSAPVKSGKNYIVFRLLDKKPAYIPAFEKIKKKVTEKYKEEKSKELLKNKAMEMKKILSSRDIKSLAVKEKLKLEQTAYFSKITGTVKITCLKNNVFSLKKKEGDFCISNGIAYIFQLKERKTLNKKEYDELKNGTRKKLEQKERETAIQDFLKQLKAKAKIRINEEALS